MRNLNKDEIECRFQSETNGKATYLLYKTARTDVALLTEAYGNRWKNSYESIDGKLYCTISVYDEELKEWVSRSNIGTESNIEKEKGEASDAFKRAGFLWGIGSELYTAPEIKVDITENDKFNGKCNLKLFIKDIEINDEHKITKLVLTDRFGNVRYNYSPTSNTNVLIPENKTLIDSIIQDCSNPVSRLFNNKKVGTSTIDISNNREILRTFCKKMESENINLDELTKFLNYYEHKVENWNGQFLPEELWKRWYIIT